MNDRQSDGMIGGEGADGSLLDFICRGRYIMRMEAS